MSKQTTARTEPHPTSATWHRSPDNLINMSDLFILARMVDGAIEPNDVESALGDIDRDGDLDLADLMMLQLNLLDGSSP